jgi:hypothetical protein
MTEKPREPEAKASRRKGGETARAARLAAALRANLARRKARARAACGAGAAPQGEKDT